MSRSGKNKVYAVAAGRKVGIFTTWFGPGGAEEQIRGFAGARFKGFTVRADAEAWLTQNREPGATRRYVGAPSADCSHGTQSVPDGSSMGSSGTR